MADVRLSEQARRDLEDIRNYGVTQFGETAAERHLRSIGQALELLSEHPLAGQARPEFRQDIRSIARRPHRILYKVDRGDVFVIRVIHQARDVPNALAREQ